MNYLDHFDDPLHLTAIYATMIAALEEVGFKAGQTLFGAPYDWRLPVDYMFEATPWRQNMQQLVETAYKTAGNNKARALACGAVVLRCVCVCVCSPGVRYGW